MCELLSDRLARPGAALALLLVLLAAPAAAPAQLPHSPLEVATAPAPAVAPGPERAPAPLADGLAPRLGARQSMDLPWTGAGAHFGAAAPREAVPTVLAVPLGLREAHRRARRAASLSRHLWIGAGIGAVAGAAFGLWVISVADCSGPTCTAERVLGVAGLTAAGAAAGAVAGGAVYLVRQ